MSMKDMPKIYKTSNPQDCKSSPDLCAGRGAVAAVSRAVSALGSSVLQPAPAECALQLQPPSPARQHKSISTVLCVTEDVKQCAVG